MLSCKLTGGGISNKRELAVPETEFTLRWGDPTSSRPEVEEHAMSEIRVTVAPAPFFDKSIKQD